MGVSYQESGSDKYFNFTFVHKSNNNQRWMFRVFTSASRLAMYYSTNGGSNWTTMWDKTMA